MARLSRLGLLRATFVGLGLVLLLPLYVLKAAIDERISAQAALRHEVVAERIFDEFERELTRVIERETVRPSSAYDAATDPAAWAPFVLGYFTVDDRRSRFAPGNALDAKRRADIEAQIPAMLAAPMTGSTAASITTVTATPAEPSIRRAPTSGNKPTERPQPSRSSPEVLRQLNVGSQRKAKMAPPEQHQTPDPMQDYAY
jgi:hypothetical protein